MPVPSRRQVLLGVAAAAGVAGCSSAATRSRAVGTPAPPATVTPTPSRRATPAPTGPATEVLRGAGARPEVALTFHGAGPAAIATALLVEAESARAPVTVFAIGSWLAGTPALARRILDGGHELANHTWSHPSDMSSLGVAAARAEFARARAELARLTGSGGAYARPSAMSRATPTVLAAAAQAGYHTVVMYEVDPLDYQDPGAALVTSRTLAAARAGGIVSMHLGHDGTVEALPAVLEGLRRRGLRPVTVAELLRP